MKMMKLPEFLLLLSLVRFGLIDSAKVLSKPHDNEKWRIGDNTCGTNQNHRTKRHDQAIFPARPPPPSGSMHGNALEFEQGQVIRYQGVQKPAKRFAVDFWLKPEGGQHNPAVVLGVFDKCTVKSETRGWFIGLREESVQSDLRVTFTLHTASALTNTTIRSHRRIEAGRWIHVAASYDGHLMKMYVNQAKVAVGRGQKGVVFDKATQDQACDVLEIGGDRRKAFFYRGQIDKLRLWGDAFTHGELSASWLEDNNAKVVFRDHFDQHNPMNAHWITMSKTRPRFVRSTVPEEKHDLSIRKPPCGVTICDNPEVVRSYLNNPDLRAFKQLKLRVINLMDNDGGRAMVTRQDINGQHEFLQQVFRPLNISWQLEIFPVRDTWLRSKIMLLNCETEQIGDGTCNQNCSHEETGNDGGDCGCQGDGCPPEKRGDEHCDPECNQVSYNWDDGDCCQTATNQHCFDPKSPNRTFVSVKEYKRRIGLNNRDAVNIYVANWRSERSVQGVATFPWDKYVHTEIGGVILPPKHIHPNGKTLIHELGHVLGLWHVHHGSEAEMNCADDCFETFPSLELGDLCSDTNPTVENHKCEDITEHASHDCSFPHYKDTPYKNYMGYGNECTDNFTCQQVARMHCYIDLDYQSWQTNAVPSSIPLSPRITSKSGNVINLSWIPPLGSGGKNAQNLCNECQEDKVLQQYASTAYSPTPSKPTGNNAPYQATGYPDAYHCSQSALSWRPISLTFTPCKNCPLYIELGFKEAVVPTSLTIWVSSESKNAFTNIQLIHTDVTVTSLGGGTAQCDEPYTRPIWDIKKKVSKVRIYVSSNHVNIDAVKLTSRVGHPNCSMCEPLKYVISREPPFESGPESSVLPTTRYADSIVENNREYVYRVRAVTDDGIFSPYSPPLVYKPEKGFCGDGKIDEDENCDDGNVRDGDGCNVQCQKEEVFRCDGRPSLCYRHDGDGVCEDFEKEKSIEDCGFYTPDGFTDQWAHSASVSPARNYKCPEKIMTGPPRHDLKCQYYMIAVDRKCNDAWSPAEDPYLWDVAPADHWAILSFQRPAIAAAIIVYLGFIHNNPSSVKFELLDVNKEVKLTLEHTLTMYCKQNPLTIPIQHDMTKSFFKTKYVKIIFPRNDEIGIAAVALRSSKQFDPVELARCESDELFHPRIQQCHKYDCIIPECSKLVIKNSQKVKYVSQREGDVALVTCAKGHTPKRSFQVVCKRGKWTVNGKPPLCSPVDCGQPFIQNAKLDCPDGTSYGKQCVYRCNEQTKQTGADPRLTCEEDGMWSEAKVFCPKICRTPANPAHAQITKACLVRPSFSPGETCKYKCHVGYSASGNRQGDGFKKTCMKDGSWSGPTCQPITCPIQDPDVLKWYNCTMRNFFGSVCKLTCPNEQENREIRCKETGKWDTTKFQLCETKSSCVAPVEVLNGPKIECNGNLSPGAECHLKCPKGFHPAIKDDQSRQHTTVNAIGCSPLLHWYPNPSLVKCLAKCLFNIIGDIYCHGKNNNADCWWDGGDCCDSTNKDGFAMKSESLCGDNCACQEPGAHDYQRDDTNGSGSYSNS